MLQRCISSSALCIKLNIFYPQICAFVQEDKDPASLLSAATTVLLRSPLRNERGGQIMFRYTLSIQWIQKQCKWHWQSCMSFQALSTMALVRSKSGDWGRSWCSRASGDILKLLFIFLASFQELSTMALDLVGSKSNWWLESQSNRASGDICCQNYCGVMLVLTQVQICICRYILPLYCSSPLPFCTGDWLYLLMGAVVEVVSSKLQVTVFVSMLMLMCLWWKFQYYKGLFQAVLCVSNKIVFIHRYVVKAIAVMLKTEEKQVIYPRWGNY